MSDYEIRHTEPREATHLAELFDYSRNIMRASGNASQWVGGYPSADIIARDIRRRVSYVITNGAEIVGTFAFIVGRDPTYEQIEGGSWEDDERPYGTIHRIACSPGHNGIFEACLEWCRRQAASIRVDTHKDNKIMLHLMEKHGFNYRGIIYVADGTPRMAFQMLNTRRICEPMREYIDSTILPKYDSFDSAHRRDHAETVITNSLELARQYDVDLNMVYAIGAYHDTGLCAGRERHHIVSGQNILGDKRLQLWFSPSQLAVMAAAAEDHRASSVTEPRSIYGKIVAEADRDIDPQKILLRTVQYGLDNYPELDKEEQWQRFVAHLDEKYAEGGYLRLWLPESKNAARLAELRLIIRDSIRLRNSFENCWENLHNPPHKTS